MRSYSFSEKLVIALVVIAGLSVFFVSALEFSTPDRHVAPVSVSEQEPPLKTKVREILEGSDNTLHVLYLGNSRVARPTGFAFDGFDQIFYNEGRLAGEGFVMPRKGVHQQDEDARFLYNRGDSMSSTSGWTANDADSVSFQHDESGLALVPGRQVKMANFANDVPLLPRDEEITLVVNYLKGPGKGSFKIVPVEVLGDMDIQFSHPETVIDTADPEFGIEFIEVLLPAMNDPQLNRAFLLEGISGEVTIYEVNVYRDVPNGVYVSEMAIGGVGYQNQVSGLDAAAWTKYAESNKPSVVFWQFAANQGTGGINPATYELMDRIEGINPDVIHIITPDHPTPRSNYATVVQNSWRWADDILAYANDQGYDAIIADPVPYLPQDFLDLAGTEELGVYFNNPVHENRDGAYVVADAIWQAMEEFVNN